jgi:peroxiredoxin
MELFFASILPWILVFLGCWLVYLLIRQYGKILLRLEALEAKLGQGAQQPSENVGLPPGIEAPAFELPDLAGVKQTLAQYRGRKVLLIFFNPSCGFCVKMVPQLAALPIDAKDRPMPLVVSTGPADANRKLIEEHKIRCPVLLQPQTEVANLYQAHGTPMGYLIDEAGMIAGPAAVGADGLLELAEPRKCNGKPARGKLNKGLAHSRINRTGLKAGSKAPAFRLPRLDGGELALRDYRGKRVLLIFSDPECGPCDQLGELLEALHKQYSHVPFIMISRRDRDRNKKKVAQFGITFPVVLQKEWEISKLYEMFGTPIAYLIDEEGVTMAEVASGVEAIVTLISSTKESRFATLTKGPGS